MIESSLQAEPAFPHSPFSSMLFMVTADERIIQSND